MVKILIQTNQIYNISTKTNTILLLFHSRICFFTKILKTQYNIKTLGESNLTKK